MRQVWITRRGGPEVLQPREAPDPEPEPGEVRVRVKAAGVNFADILIRIGLYPDAPKLPAVVGYEVAGQVDALGEGVERLPLGRRVVALMPHYGGYSDCVCIPAEEAVPIPDSISFEKAAAIPVNYMTAWLMLVWLANVQEGQRVLIHSAGGGVGLAAVQICQWKGARVIGTASGWKHDRLRQAGVEDCIDYRNCDFEKEVSRYTDARGVNIVLDAVGGKSFAKSYRCLAPLGKLIVYGVSGMVTGGHRKWLKVVREWLAMPRFDPIELITDSRGVFGVTLQSLKEQVQQRRDMLRRILEAAGRGKFDPILARSLPFNEAADAQRCLEERKNFGKVLLTP